MMEDLEYEDKGYSIQSALKQSQIEETAGKRRFYLVFEKDSIHEYEKRMLNESGCLYTLPMHFLYEEDKLKAYYDFTGFILLEDYICKQVACIGSERGNQELLYDSLEVLSKILEGIKGVEHYLLFPNRMKIEIDTIFICPDNGLIAFSFIPELKQDVTLQNRIIQIINAIKNLYCHPEIDQHLDKFISVIYQKNLGLDGMISILGMVQREVSYIYWNTKDFRKIEESASVEEEIKKETEEIAERKDTLLKKPKMARLKTRIPLKPILAQIAIVLGLAAAYLSGTFEMTNFAGLVIIVAGVDLWLMRKLHYV